MPFSWDNYPYTNFHELNLDWFINKFKEIFEEWNELYNTLTSWKTETENAIEDWESGVISDLNDWKDGFETLFNETFSNLSDIKRDAESARDRAESAADTATGAAETISDSAAQITANKNDLTVIKSSYFHGLSTNITEIPANSDLNDYKTPGNYRATTNAIANSCSNIPDNKSGRLYVFEGAVSNHIIQIYISDANGCFYIRSYITSDDTWREWVGFSKDYIDNIDELISSCFLGYASEATEIPSNSDFNSYKTVGNYKTTTNAIATSCSNCPVNISGRLYVSQGAVSNHINQIYIADALGEIFVRSYITSDDTWREWIGYTHTDKLTNEIYNTISDDYVLNKNLIDYSKVTPGTRVRVSSGAISENANYATTDYINIIPGLQIYFNFRINSDTYGTAFYDINKNFISGLASRAINQLFTVPSTAYYMKTTMSTSNYTDGTATAKIINKETNVIISDKTKWLAVGDSITYGIYSTDSTHEYYTDNSWVNLTANALNFDKLIMASRGMGYSSTVTGKDPEDPDGDRINLDTLLTRIEALTEEYNLITMQFGINDYGTQTTTLETIATGLNDAIERLVTKFPKARLIVITPFNSSREGDATTNYAYNATHGTSDKTLKDIADKIKERCVYYGIECLYLTNGFLLNNYNIQTLLPDNTHPSLDCHKLIAKNISHFLIY